MKARVITNLNIRTGSPDILPNNNPGFYRPGDILDIRATVTGRSYKRNNIWYELTDGSFVWSGGVNRGISSFANRDLNTSIIANDLAKKLILKNGNTIKNDGNNIVVGVLDSGIDITHDSLRLALIGSEENNLEDHDNSLTNPHGTSVAGLIAGNENFVSGMAIGAKLKSYKIINSANGAEPRAFKTSIEHIAKTKDSDILNFSFAINESNIPKLREPVAALVSQGVIMVVAGNVDGGSDINPLTQIGGLIKVGAFNSFADRETLSVMDVGFLNKEIITTGIKSQEISHVFSDSSAYCAIVTGVIARFLSTNQIPKTERIAVVKNFLQANSFDIENNLQPFKMYHP